MRFLPIVAAFTIALIGAVAVGFRPGYAFSTLFIGATTVAAMTGLAVSVLQFLPPRYFLPTAIVSSVILGLLVTQILRWSAILGFGLAQDAVALVWPVAIMAGLFWGHATGMDFPTIRRRSTVEQPRAR